VSAPPRPPRSRRGRAAGTVRRHHRRRAPHRAAGLDAGGLPEDARPADRAARALRDHRDAARGRLAARCAQPPAQGDPAGQGPGRGRSRALPLRRGGDAGRRPRRPDRQADRGQAEVQLDLQLPHAHLCRRRRHRLARGRRGHLQPGAPLPQLLRPVRTGDDPRLQGGVVPPAAGLRAADDDDAGHRRAAGDGAGRRGPVVVALADDVRAAGRRQPQLGAVHGMGHQAAQQRRAAAAIRRHVGPAGGVPRRHAARPRSLARPGDRPPPLRRDRLGRTEAGHQRQRPGQRGTDRQAPRRPRRQRVGDRGRDGLRREALTGRGM
ncbi:MAG: 1,2-phenylacetyl-CoA epoxidase, subunit A, partial [uncultured Pseudonocardia sp.]